MTLFQQMYPENSKYLLRHFKEALRISTNRPETDYARRRLSSDEIKQDRKRRQGSNQIGSVTLIPMPGKASNGIISLIQHIYEAVLRFHLGLGRKGIVSLDLSLYRCKYNTNANICILSKSASLRPIKLSQHFPSTHRKA